MADLLLKKLKAPKFSWGTTRAKYISALKLADQGDFKALLIFARSS
ncbi:MAG: hypothetical protein LW875_11950 [Proteobacteria bacterium]|nr:hypothetical protein [Pseudomonadota bacterium]